MYLPNSLVTCFICLWFHLPRFLQEVITSYTGVSTLTAILFVNLTPANGEGLLSCIEPLLQHHTGTPQLYIVYWQVHTWKLSNSNDCDQYFGGTSN